MTMPRIGEGSVTKPSIRALADLARTGYSLLRAPYMKVDFELHHLVDRPGHLTALVSADEPYLETLSSAANGAAVVVGIRTASPQQGEIGFDDGNGSPAAVVATENEDSITFAGTAQPSLTTIYEGSTLFEGIVVLENEPRRLLLRHGLGIRDVIYEITRLAAEIGNAPILSLQSPVQIPPHSYNDYAAEANQEKARTEQNSRAYSLAVRFAIALQERTAVTRLQLAEKLAFFCAQRGLGLWLADSRPGYRTGNWFIIEPHERAKARAAYSRAADRRGAGTAEGCLPVTFVGPARVGSAHAIMSFLAQFPEVGILACAVTALNDLTFIHLQLAVNGASRPVLSRLNSELKSMRGANPDLATTLRDLIPMLIRGEPTTGINMNAAERLETGAGDYQALLGPAFRVISHHTDARVAIWIAWRMRRAARGLQTPLESLRDALKTIGLSYGGVAGANVEYLICRHIGNSIFRGKGKISVSEAVVERLFADRGRRPALSRCCSTLERAWKTQLDGGDAVSEVSVAWREYWLGHGGSLA
jgi:hypothetical protein